MDVSLSSIPSPQHPEAQQMSFILYFTALHSSPTAFTLYFIPFTLCCKPFYIIPHVTNDHVSTCSNWFIALCQMLRMPVVGCGRGQVCTRRRDGLLH